MQEAMYNVLKAVYQQQLGAIFVQMMDVRGKEITIDKAMAEQDPNSFTYQALKIAKTKCEIEMQVLRVQWDNLVNSLNALSNDYAQRNPEAQPLLSEIEARIAAATPVEEVQPITKETPETAQPATQAPATEEKDSITEKMSMTIQVEFEQLQQLFEQYKAAKEPEAQEKLAAQMETQKATITKLKSRLSAQQRRDLKAGKITQEQFDAFKLERSAAYKEHTKFYAEVTREIQKVQGVKTETQQKEAEKVKTLKPEQPTVEPAKKGNVQTEVQQAAPEVQPIKNNEPQQAAPAPKVEPVQQAAPEVQPVQQPAPEVQPIKKDEPQQAAPQPEVTPAKKTDGPVYGVQPQRMKDSATLNKVTERVNAARTANVSANSLRSKLEQTKAGFEQRMSDLETRLAQLKTATSKAITSLESDLKKAEMSTGVNSEDYRLVSAQLEEERKKQAKAQRKEERTINAEMRAARKEEKKEERTISSQIRAQDKAEKKETRRAGIKSDIRHADEAKRAGEELTERQAKRQDLLRQRDRLATELNQMRSLYGTANNEEYQMRIDQLKELDKQILGHKAKRIYRDLSKPIALIGGDYVELPKKYLDMRLQHTEAKSK